jgi:hypothetical protein
MRTRAHVFAIGTAAGVLAAAWLAAPMSAAQAGRPGTAALIADLNDCIQERFKDVDDTFGFRRIVRLGETPHRFRPENARELGAVRELERARTRVVLFLTGRQVLRPDATTVRPVTGLPMIKGPVLVTSGRDAADAPRAADLLDDSRRAFAAFDRGDSHEFSTKTWSVAARPVRATDRVCLRCHSADGRAFLSPRDADGSLRLGDALGVVLYAVQPVK